MRALTRARMIAIFDEDGGGDVDFQEFVSGLSAFSSKGNKEQKLRFAFKVYDIDRDGYISNGELFIVLKMMVGSNLKDQQLQQIVDKTIMEADLDRDGKISFEEFTKMVENTDVSMSMTLGRSWSRKTWTQSLTCFRSILIHPHGVLGDTILRLFYLLSIQAKVEYPIHGCGPIQRLSLLANQIFAILSILVVGSLLCFKWPFLVIPHSDAHGK